MTSGSDSESDQNLEAYRGRMAWYEKRYELFTTSEQAKYNSFEKSILAVASAMFVFSASFLGLFRPGAGSPPHWRPLLYISWTILGCCVLLSLGTTLKTALDTRALVEDVKRKRDGESELYDHPAKAKLIFRLYKVQIALIGVGLMFLLLFIGLNT